MVTGLKPGVTETLPLGVLTAFMSRHKLHQIQESAGAGPLPDHENCSAISLRPILESDIAMEPTQRYDRNLLLYGPKRNAVLELWEVRRYGGDSFGDENYVSIFGLTPDNWYERGVRLLGRTAVECTRDCLGDRIGQDVAEVVASSPAPDVLVVDPFVGSGNTLYWLLRHLPGARGLGFESDAGVFQLTRNN